MLSVGLSGKRSIQHWTIPNARSAPIQHSTFHIPHCQRQPFHILIADAALYAEGGEECGDYAHDKLEHGLECFFVWVFHGILIIKVIDMTSRCIRDAFGRRVLLFILQSYDICGWQSYVSVRYSTNFWILSFEFWIMRKAHFELFNFELWFG